MYSDPLYFKREQLAKGLLLNLKEGITHAITLFAPRRMGKTQFLLNDVQPQAKAMGFNVFYFSFMDNQAGELSVRFTQALQAFAIELDGVIAQTVKNITSVSVLGVGIGKDKSAVDNTPHVSQLLNLIAKESKKPTLLLLDEVQELAREPSTEGLIKSLRTGLDTNQQKIKVIFTGSSTNGLRAMFNDNKAPFFHFAHPMDFPMLDKSFTDFLANVYHARTGRELDKTTLYNTFKEQLGSIPLYMRSIIQDMIVNPTLPFEQALARRVEELNERTDYSVQWRELNALEQQIILHIFHGNSRLYTHDVRQRFAEKLGVDSISSSQIQGQVRKLTRADLITKGGDNTFKIGDSHFHAWLKNTLINEAKP
ncbi:ATP-binding protein [Pasteurellaceae bacterium 20609_3]|uniref:ATP-binding protein n=1 Tax=Spirabiliibacterium mucosae TaxID=28156 RepID=UPI001AAC5CFD|nr:ATP-binding protein [Spirabiliibacterium mucosae]MBE2899049.1 ATP-binding protein [Spirabiliibacterium mucosae]